MDGHEDMKASTIALVVAFILAVAASFWFGGEYVRRRESMPADTVYVDRWVRDTLRLRDTVSLGVEHVTLKIHDTAFSAVHDTLHKVDSVMVEVPITEKTYAGENYRAIVRGFQPELVDIWVRQMETKITVPYRKRWSFTAGPQVGVGYTPQGWQPYAGAGVTFGYNF